MEICDRCKKKFDAKDVCPIVGLCVKCENKSRRLFNLRCFEMRISLRLQDKVNENS